ncbi:helix-turn-helix transcriptional regulator [Algibacter miyuki]|uniref:Helix-turn-helix transcriptional regulator n=1 Tax=Algibacter miyuki TaxID=1306933 RepID=A0ABV5H2S9_9FLAO|nr:AraC family transcriptional regulator [Algibacter miyuki]MDN3663864.1 AraC family transcriptional regulator [Algibacter miyuki]
MINSIKIINNKEIIFDNAPSTIVVDGCGTREVTTVFDSDALKGSYKELIYYNFKIGYGTFHNSKNNSISFDFKGETVGMVFVKKGCFGFNIEKISHTNHFNKNEHNIFFYTSISGALEISEGVVSLVRINFSLKFFNQFLPDENKFKDFRKQIKQNKTGKLKKENCYISSKMHLLIDKIVNSKWTGGYRNIHMNSLVLELLLLQLDQFKNGDIKETKSNDEEKIIKIEAYLAKNFAKPLTLEFLSKKFGTNEFTLKKSFKAAFGNTVFGYIFDLKMNKAKELLIENKHTISDISEIVGYKNAQHFSTAFKKKYGVTPSKFINDN